MKLVSVALAAVVFAGSGFTTTSAFAGPPSAFGPAVKVGEARDGFLGKLDVAPSHGKAGEPFTVSGVNLPPNQEFQLVWRSVTGAWKVTEAQYKGREFVTVAYQMAKSKTEATGI